MGTDDAPLTLSDLLRAIGQSWRIVVGGAAVGGLLGFAVHVALPQTYTATTAVRVDPTGVDPLATTPPATVDLATEEQVAMSQRVARSLDITAEAVEQSAVLKISCTSSSPRSAVRGADRVAAAYLADRHRKALSRARGVRHDIDRQIHSMGREVPASVLNGLRADLARSERLRTGGGEIIDRARSPESGNRPALALTMSAGGLLGLLVMTPLASARARPARRPTEVVVVDAPGTNSTSIREGMASLADHVLVVRRAAAELDVAERWCRRLRSVGIPATVVSTDDSISRSREDLVS